MSIRMSSARLAEAVRACRPPLALVAILVAGAALLFTNLGRDRLWEDEGDTAVLAATILKTGLPKAWDGVTFSESDHGERLTRDLIMVSHPWAQYYAVAASFAMFGQNAFAARLPFALAGLATIGLVYLLTLRATGDRRAAASAALLLLVSVQFLLFSRQSRHYTLHAFFTCLLVWQFFRLRSWRSTVLFAVAGILLFHTHPIGIAAVGALAALSLVVAPLAPYRRWVWRAMPLVAAGTLPWLLLSWRGYGENVFVLERVGQFFPRLVQFAVEWSSVTPLLGVLTLGAGVWWNQRRTRAAAPAVSSRWRRPVRPDGVFTAAELALIWAVAGVALAEACVIAVSESRDVLWVTGLRHTPAILPFTMIPAGMLLAKAGRTRARWALLMAVFLTTNLGRATPWAFGQPATPYRDSQQLATFHLPPEVTDRVFRTSLLGYLTALVQPNPGTVAKIVEFLQTHAHEGDILVTNYEWEPIYFHTGLPQGLKVPATDASYQPARALGLPEYVFTGGRVRWIVWRRAWGSEWGQDCPRLVKALLEAGVSVRVVASVPETMWENRENVHFRRYPGNRYIYPWFDNLPDAEILEVDWPTNPSGSAARAGGA